MTVTLAKLNAMLTAAGSDVTYHLENGGTECPCRTREGYRDPQWHLDHPGDPVCNELGMLPVVTEWIVKASMQPVSAGGVRRTRNSERVERMFPGEIRADDHIGFFPCVWAGHTLDFALFSDTGESYVLYDNRRFLVVSYDKLPDIDGDPNHHWEVGLRMVTTERVTD